MSKYRVKLIGGGMQGYWTVEQKIFFFWVVLNKYSIYAYGNKGAHKLAKESLSLLNDDYRNDVDL